MNSYYHALLGGEKRGLTASFERAGLRLLSIPYGWAARGRNWLYDRGWKKRFAAAVPVISVGNLTVGGTGKTPCVEYVARFLRRHGMRVAILSRGYGSAEGCNDEALVLEENLPDVPHLQDADRVAIAQVAVEELESEVLVLDDGFQHRRLARSLDIVLVDATCPWGHGFLLPRGLLREPVAGLKRAQVIALTHCDQASSEAISNLRSQVGRQAPHATIVETTHRPARWINAAGRTTPVESLLGRPWIGFCGIGNPAAFRQTLSNLGGNLVDWRTYADHHGYTREDVDELRRWASSHDAGAVAVTTQKDLVKIRLDHLGDKELWALAIELDMRSGQAEFQEQLLAAARRAEGLGPLA